MASKGKRTKSQSGQLLGKGSDKATKFKEDEKESLAFKIINAEQTKILCECNDVDLLQGKMAEILKITDHVVDPKEGAVLDYYVSGVWWSKENSFSPEQTSAFFTVLHNLLDNVKEKHLPITENLNFFKKLLAGIGQDNCELSGGLECFDIKQASLIVEYVHNSLFQHYKLYEFMFGATPAEEIIGTDLVIEVPPAADLPWPPPLEEAVSDDMYNEFIATPPPTAPTTQSGEGLDGESGEAAGKTAEELEAEGERVADLMSQLTTEQVNEVMNAVFEDMLGGLKSEVASKLRAKENDFINRINKIHRIPSDKK